MSRVMRVRGPGELVAAVPYLLGFTPQDSVVCVPLGGGPVARLDFPHEEGDIDPAVSALALPYLRDRLDVAVLLMTDDRAAAEKTGLALRRRLESQVRVPLMLWVDASLWTDLATGESGEILQQTRDTLAAEAVFGGRRLPAISRETLAAEVQPDPVGVAAVDERLPPARTFAAQVVREGNIGEEAIWVGDTVGNFCRSQRPLDDQAAARLLADMAIPELRDHAWLLMTQTDAGAHVALWADLTRRSPAEVRTPAASLLAFASWLDGNGARSWVALDLLTDQDLRGYPLAALTSEVLSQAVPPKLWETHRLAGEAMSAVQVGLQRAHLATRPAAEPQQRHRPNHGPNRGGPASPAR